MKSVFFRIYDPKKFAAINPIKIKKITKTISPKPGTSLGKYVLGFKYKGNSGVISLSKILTRDITIQKVITTGAVTSMPVKK
jgi:hypothetical protein